MISGLKILGKNRRETSSIAIWAEGKVEGEMLFSFFFFKTFSSFEVWLKRKAQKGQLTLSKLQSVCV